MTARRAAGISCVLVLAFAGCRPEPIAETLPQAPAGAKILVFGIPGVRWEDLARADTPNIDELLRRGASANISVRISNRAAEGYAALGAGQRTDADPSAGWAFNSDEIVEHAAAEVVHSRRGGSGRGAVYLVTIENLKSRNAGRAFDSRPGSLAEHLEASGKVSAVIGNADWTTGSLPSVLPTAAAVSQLRGPDPGIHREAALVAMRTDGTVAFGDVGRRLVVLDDKAAFGVAASTSAVSERFQQLWQMADLIVVEAGDTSRADNYSIGLPEEQAAPTRVKGLELADGLLGSLLSEVDTAKTYVMLVGPSTPGGPLQRGELRVGAMAGPGVAPGVLTSSTTRRAGLITMPDVTALIANLMGTSGVRFMAGHVPTVVSTPEPVAFLIDMNTRAVIHDRIRIPTSIVVVGANLVIWVVAIFAALRSGPVRFPGWLIFLLLSSLAFPLASFASRAAIWRAGVAWAVGAVIGSTLLLGALAYLPVGLRKLRGYDAAAILISATAALFAADVILGTPAQIDSILGYTSVAAGRFFGLGNLGFAIFAACVLLGCGSIAGRQPWGRLAALGVIFVALVLIGHPQLGADLGGTIAMVPAAVTFFYALSERRVRAGGVLLVALGALAALAAFGLIDLSQPEGERTHVGDFVAQFVADPLATWPVIRRKISLAVTLSVSTGWGVGAIVAGAALIAMQARLRSRWATAFQERKGLRAALRALVVAAVVGSVVNDSGPAVAGMMLAILTPWVLILVADETSPRGSAVAPT